MRTESEIKEAVQKRYGEIAAGQRSCCGGGTASPAGAGGYSREELSSLPEGAALGLGCGVPARLAPLEPGMTVLDLGSGGGVDVFLAARQVGPAGRVIGVDLTDLMLARARANAAAGGYANVEFRKGDIESLPVESGSIDVILSNCVINLAPDKRRVFAEAWRVLKPGGRMQFSDIVTRGEMPAAVRRDLESWAGCVAGALDRDVYLGLLREAGFSRVDVVGESPYDAYRTAGFAALSISVVAVK